MTPYMFLLTIAWCSLSLCVTGDVFGQAHYCWNGTDDYTARRNMSCETGETFMGNMLSTKMYPTPETTSPRKSEGAFFCMMFEYFITGTSFHEDERFKSKEILYSCDTEHLCDGKVMMEGYEAEYKGWNGNVYCCNSDNCNTENLSHTQEHRHTCINAVKDQTTSLGEVRRCPREKMPCLRTKKIKRTVLEPEKFIEERFSCDLLNICAKQNLTSVLEKACKVLWDEANGFETEICCCKGDNCFIPDWFEVHHHEEGQSGKAQQRQEQNWQRTLLICIGVALAFLAVFVSFCFVRRTMQMRKQQNQELSWLEYRVIQSEALDHEDEGDSVKIIPPDKR